ncbi:hypothetical protein DFH28DRAFT_857074, partial [Melampsora americana]
MPATRKVSSTPLSFVEREALNSLHISKRLELSTIAKYKSATRRFEKFCSDHHIDVVPNEVNLAHFVSVTCLDLSPSSANKYLTGIAFCLRDRFPFVEEARNSSRVKLSVQGCRKMYSVPIVRAKPFTIHDIHLCAKTFASSFDDQLFNTIVALGFAGLHRLGELTDNDSIALRVPRQ